MDALDRFGEDAVGGFCDVARLEEELVDIRCDGCQEDIPNPHLVKQTRAEGAPELKFFGHFFKGRLVGVVRCGSGPYYDAKILRFEIQGDLAPL